ncbi:MAG: inorganic diphosphatase, partial [Candidatus Tectomicrobia bacterium]|nr:inorganic diphosphatase [Candidatus Tectomicrobia bacterium]
MDISPGTGIPRVANAIIEIPKGHRNKFEVDKETGLFRLDRYLYSSSHYPGDYGFIPQTLAEDGDPLDVLVMVNEPTFTGCLIEARIVGLFRMRDRGQNDWKVLGVPHTDPLFTEFNGLDDVPRHFLREVEHFFLTYKQLEGVTVEAIGWAGAGDAVAEVRASVDRYRDRHPGHARSVFPRQRTRVHHRHRDPRRADDVPGHGVHPRR